MNKIILSGNLCQDMTLKYTPNNVAVLNNTIAVRNNYKNAKQRISGACCLSYP